VGARPGNSKILNLPFTETAACGGETRTGRLSAAMLVKGKPTGFDKEWVTCVLEHYTVVKKAVYEEGESKYVPVYVNTGTRT
jgi:hypothetical protein